MTRKARLWLAAVVGGAILLVIIAFFVVVFGGVVNVGATEGHSAPVEWVLRTTMENSVENHAESVVVPDTLDLRSRAFATQFYGHYSAACQTCHAAPGKKADPWMVIYPEPPKLTDPEVVGRSITTRTRRWRG